MITYSKYHTLTPQDFNRDLYASTLKRLSSRYRRFVRWHSAVAHHLATGAELDVRKMPSKATKHHMYDDASQLMRILGVYGDGSMRPSTLDEIGDLVNWARTL